MLRAQLLLLTLIPIAFLSLALAALVFWESRSLSRALTAQVEARMLADRREALRNYATIAQSAIEPYRQASAASQNEFSQTALQDQAKEVLSAMTFGEDGYFYVYTYEGQNLVHPRLTHLVGQDLWDLEDPLGDKVIQGLVGQAQQGGGYHGYIWNKPSTNLDTAKIGYAVGIEEWGWMLGTGLYLDDLAQETSAISATIDQIIGSTLRWFLGLCLVAVIAAGLIVYAFKVRLQQRANGQLQALNKRIVDIQEIQAKRISQDLHDGVSQALVLAKFSIEDAETAIGEDSAAKKRLACARGNLDQALTELRQVARSLRPPALDQLGLSNALGSLIDDFRTGSQLTIVAQLKSFGAGLSDFSKVALFRVAQEALTNIRKHAEASDVEINLYAEGNRAHLVIEDNGRGVSSRSRAAQSDRGGFGLQNMSERLHSLGGVLTVKPRRGGGTCLSGWVPMEPSS